MIRNKKGFTEVAILISIISGLILFFVPNPVSSTLGMGIKPNKTVHTERLVPIKVNGKEVLMEHTDEEEIQQHVTFWEWLRSLPIMVVILMALGIVFPPVSIFLHNLWSTLKADTKKIVVGVDKALDKVHDPAIKQTMLDEMNKVQDTSTKVLVNKIQGK